MIEVLARMRLPVAPILPDEVARKADLGTAVNVDTAPPPSPVEGALWFDSVNLRLMMWYANQWLEITAFTPQAPGAVWDGGLTLWDGGGTIWDASLIKRS